MRNSGPSSFRILAQEQLCDRQWWSQDGAKAPLRALTLLSQDFLSDFGQTFFILLDSPVKGAPEAIPEHFSSATITRLL